MNYPKKVEKGSTIALVCPSSPIKQEDIETFTQAMWDLGYEVILGKTLSMNKGGFMAGEPQERIDELHEFFANPKVDGIFCVRGGDSSIELLQGLDAELIKQNPKVFMGYSDITNLHVFLNQCCDLITFHGPMVKSNIMQGLTDYEISSMELAFQGEGYFYGNPPGDPLLSIREGHASGRLVGGNLSLLCAGLGGPYEVDTKGKILLLEDINESVEHLHRMLWQLKYAGKFEDASAVLLGDFNNCENAHEPAYDQEVLFKEFFQDYPKPVLMRLRSGHCSPMSTLPLGAKAKIIEGKLFIEGSEE